MISVRHTTHSRLSTCVLSCELWLKGNRNNDVAGVLKHGECALRFSKPLSRKPWFNQRNDSEQEQLFGEKVVVWKSPIYGRQEIRTYTVVDPGEEFWQKQPWHNVLILPAHPDMARSAAVSLCPLNASGKLVNLRSGHLTGRVRWRRLRRRQSVCDLGQPFCRAVVERPTGVCHDVPEAVV